MSERSRIVAIQGETDEGREPPSYHALAARELFGPHALLEDWGDFGKVIHQTRQEAPYGMGVIAVKTVQGTVKKSVAEVVNVVPDALSPVTGRVDIDVSFLLVSAEELGIEDLTMPAWKHRVLVHAHPEAWRQSEDTVRELLAKPRFIGSPDNIKAVRTVKELDKPDHVAISPVHAVEPLGVHPVSDRQLNPSGSKTRFYGLQRDPTLQLLVPNHKKTTKRTVVSITHPESPGAIHEVLQLFERMKLQPMDFISFPPEETHIDSKAKNELLRQAQDQGWMLEGLGLAMDVVRHRNGGIFEIEGDLYASNLREFCARVSRIKAPEGTRGRFMTQILGGFNYYPEEPMDLDAFADRYDEEPDPERPLVVRDEQPEGV